MRGPQTCDPQRNYYFSSKRQADIEQGTGVRRRKVAANQSSKANELDQSKSATQTIFHQKAGSASALYYRTPDEAMLYYRLWVYSFNIAILLSVLTICSLSHYHIVSEPRIVLVPEFNYKDANLFYVYVTFCLQLGIIQLIGCVGVRTLREPIIKLFWQCLLVLVIGDSIFGIYWTFKYHWLLKGISPNLKEKFLTDYGFDGNFTKIMDLVQMEDRCCGAIGALDYYRNQSSKSEHSAIDSRNGSRNRYLFVPESCCIPDKSPYTTPLPDIDELIIPPYPDFRPPLNTSDTIHLDGGLIMRCFRDNYVFHNEGCDNRVISWFQETFGEILAIACGIHLFLKVVYSAILYTELNEMIEKIGKLRAAPGGIEQSMRFEQAGRVGVGISSVLMSRPRKPEKVIKKNDSRLKLLFSRKRKRENEQPKDEADEPLLKKGGGEKRILEYREQPCCSYDIYRYRRFSEPPSMRQFDECYEEYLNNELSTCREETTQNPEENQLNVPQELTTQSSNTQHSNDNLQLNTSQMGNTTQQGCSISKNKAAEKESNFHQISQIKGNEQQNFHKFRSNTIQNIIPSRNNGQKRPAQRGISTQMSDSQRRQSQWQDDPKNDHQREPYKRNPDRSNAEYFRQPTRLETSHQFVINILPTLKKNRESLAPHLYNDLRRPSTLELRAELKKINTLPPDLLGQQNLLRRASQVPKINRYYDLDKPRRSLKWYETDSPSELRRKSSTTVITPTNSQAGTSHQVAKPVSQTSSTLCQVGRRGTLKRTKRVDETTHAWLETEQPSRRKYSVLYDPNEPFSPLGESEVYYSHQPSKSRINKINTRARDTNEIDSFKFELERLNEKYNQISNELRRNSKRNEEGENNYRDKETKVSNEWKGYKISRTSKTRTSLKRSKFGRMTSSANLKRKKNHSKSPQQNDIDQKRYTLHPDSAIEISKKIRESQSSVESDGGSGGNMTSQNSGEKFEVITPKVPSGIAVSSGNEISLREESRHEFFNPRFASSSSDDCSDTDQSNATVIRLQESDNVYRNQATPVDSNNSSPMSDTGTITVESQNNKTENLENSTNLIGHERMLRKDFPKLSENTQPLKLPKPISPKIEIKEFKAETSKKSKEIQVLVSPTTKTNQQNIVPPILNNEPHPIPKKIEQKKLNTAEMVKTTKEMEHFINKYIRCKSCGFPFVEDGHEIEIPKSMAKEKSERYIQNYKNFELMYYHRRRRYFGEHLPLSPVIYVTYRGRTVRGDGSPKSHLQRQISKSEECLSVHKSKESFCGPCNNNQNKSSQSDNRLRLQSKTLSTSQPEDIMDTKATVVQSKSPKLDKKAVSKLLSSRKSRVKGSESEEFEMREMKAPDISLECDDRDVDQNNQIDQNHLSRPPCPLGNREKT